MQIQQFVTEVQRQPVFRQDGKRAPNKPLTVLFALGLAGRCQRVIRYADAEQRLTELLIRFGPPRDNPKPEQAVWRLRDREHRRYRVWYIENQERVGTVGDDDPRLSDLRAHAAFGLSDEAYELFAGKPHIARFAAECIADELLPDTEREELLEAIGLGGEDFADATQAQQADLELHLTEREQVLSRRSRRYAAFAKKVLAAYAHRCAICSVAPKLGERHFGLEAAHIRWVQADGPDTIPNGLCLCRMHHVALDRGAITFDRQLKLDISPHLTRSDGFDDWIGRYYGTRLQAPSRAEDHPHEQALDWHRSQVFKG